MAEGSGDMRDEWVCVWKLAKQTTKKEEKTTLSLLSMGCHQNQAYGAPIHFDVHAQLGNFPSISRDS